MRRAGKNMLKNRFYALFVFAIIVIYGCAAPPKEVKLIYPSPPEEPRLVYLKSYSGESNFKKKGFLEFVLGEEQFRAELRKPYGVTAYGDKVYVTDTGSAGVFVFDLKEQKVTFMGDKELGKLALPIGVAVTSDGIVFVSDAKQKRVFGYDANGNLKIALGKKDEFKTPAGIAINNGLGRTIYS